MSGIPLRRLGESGLELPTLGFGGAPLGNLFLKVPEIQAQQTLQAAWDCGIRYFDTAPWYGHGLSEHRIGHLLRQRKPTTFLCSTKVGRVYSRFRGRSEACSTEPWAGGLPFTYRFDYTYDGVMRSYEDSLMRLGLNRINVLVIHDLDFGYHRNESNVAQKFRELESGWRALAELKNSYEIQAIGAGINDEKMMMRFLDQVPLDFFLVAMPFTLMDQDVLDKEFPACERKGVGIVVGAPYASGILAADSKPDSKYRYAPASREALDKVSRIETTCKHHGVPLKAAALQFPLRHPLVASIIPGAITPGQVRENRDLVNFRIPSDLWAELKHEGLIREDSPVDV